ncbi:helix-turn-helix transcriptional regulator [Nocardioides sp. J2M5]|uniref:PadR family transcriptional regulator n=1 Tax=Nocardioides palaemonis TaxID=2829810 RepID=UPI001BACEEA2|nr:helix-turn-helix transcriptional regulator [Nocardioides palaemonis]MBS2940308.1 helix-turn-helix transcriptional regulator [Nocardioides palaemonis]
MTDARWPAPWVRAALDVAVLATLDAGPLHGYAVAQALAERGFGLLKGGSLYPVLNRLEEGGDVDATWVEGQGGPGRKAYDLTAQGRTRLRHDLAAWRELGETMTTMTTGPTGATRDG